MGYNCMNEEKKLRKRNRETGKFLIFTYVL